MNLQVALELGKTGLTGLVIWLGSKATIDQFGHQHMTLVVR